MKRLSLIFALLLVLALAIPVMAGEPHPGAGTTNFTVQNLDSAADATVSAVYVSQLGASDATIPATISPRASQGFPASTSGLQDNWAGSVVISSDKKIVAFGQAIWQNTDLTSTEGRFQTAGAYNGFEQGANKLFLPSLAARSSKQFSSVSVQSAAQPSTSASITFSITFYDRTGAQTLQIPSTTINEGAQATFDLTSGTSDLTAGNTTEWLGAAVIESSSPIAAVATTHWTNYSAAYSAVTSGGTKAFLPSVNRRVPNGSTWLQFTSVVIQNLDASTASDISVIWYDRDGNALYTFTDQIPANSATGYNTRFIGSSGVPAAHQDALQAALGDNWTGSVVIESTSGQSIVAVANLQWTASHVTSPNAASGYTSFASGTAEVFVPAVFRRGSGDTSSEITTQFTGLIVQNVGAADCTYTMDWFARGSTTASISLTDTIAPNIAAGYNTKQGFNDGTDPVALGFDFRGSVYINGSGCELVAVHNTVWPIWSDSTTYNAFGQ